MRSSTILCTLFYLLSLSHSTRSSKAGSASQIQPYLTKAAGLRRMLQDKGDRDEQESSVNAAGGGAQAEPAQLVADRQRLQREIELKRNSSATLSGERMSAALQASEMSKSEVHDDFSSCNVTIACEPCPSDAIRDLAEYCLKTGWRQRVRCIFRQSGREEMFFESCAVPGVLVPQSAKVMQFEMAMLAILVGSWAWMQKRKRLQPGRGGDEKRGGYEPLAAL